MMVLSLGSSVGHRDSSIPTALFPCVFVNFCLREVMMVVLAILS